MTPPKAGEKTASDERDTLPPITRPEEVDARRADAEAVKLDVDGVEPLVPEPGAALPPTKPVDGAAEVSATNRPTLRPAEALAAESAAESVAGADPLDEGWAAPVEKDD